MSKQYVIAGFVGTGNSKHGTFLGYIGRYGADEGDPYYAGKNKPVFHDSLTFPESVLDNIRTADIVELSTGETYLNKGNIVSLFETEYCNVTQTEKYTERSISVKIIEYDFSNPENVITTVLETAYAVYRLSRDHGNKHLVMYSSL